MRNNNEVSVMLTKEDLIEISVALVLKVDKITDGDYGPEETPGDDIRWIVRLKIINQKIEAALYGSARAKR